MTGYILRRIVQLVPVLLFISAIVFFVFRIIPGDAVAVSMGEGADRESAEAMRRQLGLDKPVVLQYFDWLGNVLRGDLGYSLINRQSVLSLVLEKLGATLLLTVLSVLLALVISLPVGIISALRRGTWLDHSVRLLALAGFCMPRYWLAILLILFLAVGTGWFPVAGYVPLSESVPLSLYHAVLPTLSIGLSLAALQMRFLRSSLLDVISQDYVRTAYSKGLRHPAVVLGHVLKNTLIPFVTVVGLEFGNLIGGQVVTEQIFAWPGVGWLMIQSINQRDYAVVQGAVLVVATGFVIVNLLVDIAYAYLDPRIRYV
jgi:peptide/nickel transport system permease protein